MMHDLITQLVTTLNNWGYWGIFILMAMESSLFPIPSEIVMPPAGYLVQQGKMQLIYVILSGTMGSLAGALANYYLARWLGRPLLIKYGVYLLISEQQLYRAEHVFNTHGIISTFIGRLLPVIRHLISLPAGLSKMNLWHFCLYTLLGACIWVSILTGLGFFLGQNQALLTHYASQILMAIVIVCTLVVGIYIVKRRV